MMAVFISGQKIKTGSLSANGGIFIGQNIEDGWDSSTPEKVATGYSMGDFSATPCGISIYIGSAYERQSIHDGDIKGNFTIHTEA
jgi:hypothetical protein